MSKLRPSFLGVDLGTTSLAAVLVDGRGKALQSWTAANPSAGEVRQGRDEQDADAILAAAEKLIAQAEAAAKAANRRIVAIGWTGQMHGLVAVDRQLRALTPFVTWRDKRCQPPRLGVGIMEDWRRRKLKGIYRALSLPGLALARRTGRCLVDSTFLSSMGEARELARFGRWLPELDESFMLGDNQAGVYAALRLKPHALVVNLGTSGQLSQVVGAGERVRLTGPAIDTRPFPGGRRLLCRASHLGGAALSRLRRQLGVSWAKLNAEAERNPRIRACIDEIIGDLTTGADLRGIRTIVGLGNALRLNPCLRKALERNFHATCFIPEVEEMAAYGAALLVRGAFRRS